MKYDDAVAAARRHARDMVVAEHRLGEVVAAAGLPHVDQLARDVGVRRSVLINAALVVRGVLKRHRRLERAGAADA